MGEEKKKKKKKKEQDESAPSAEEAPVAAAEPEPEEPKKKSKKKSSKKKSSRATSGAFSIFSEELMNTFKKGFDFIDVDKDGVIEKEDIRRCYDNIGIIAKDADLDALIAEPPAPVTFTMFLTMFGEKMGQSGETDSDKDIKWAFKAFDPEKTGGIDPVHFEEYLSEWGDKFTPAEVQLIFPQLPRVGDCIPEHPDYISISEICRMLSGGEDNDETGASSSEA